MDISACSDERFNASEGKRVGPHSLCFIHSRKSLSVFSVILTSSEMISKMISIRQ